MIYCFSPASRIILIERAIKWEAYCAVESFSPASRIILIERINTSIPIT